MTRKFSFRKGQPWLYTPGADFLFILFPAFAVSLSVILFPDFFESNSGLNPLLWFLLVVGIDVAHVYSTLYRTYFDAEERKTYGNLLWSIPVFAFLGGLTLFLLDGEWFWRGMAYLAVFHFIRQQYGFMRLYSRKEQNAPGWEKWVDASAIYMAALYPIIFWHSHPREFNWFVEGDFFVLSFPEVEKVALLLWVISLSLFAGKEMWKFIRTDQFNLPKFLIVSGTALSWYIGIVAFNGDLSFTLTNVIAHGIPYMALIWIYERKKANPRDEKKFFRPFLIPVFVGFLILLAWLEEGFWDGLVWGDHAAFFPGFSALPSIKDSALLALVVPLLAVPQLTHYLLDGFIWKVQSPENNVAEILD